MRGVITGRDVVLHLALIRREFGLLCAFRCLRAVLRGESTTFLDVALRGSRAACRTERTVSTDRHPTLSVPTKPKVEQRA